ncbi:MAG: hypothetical protein Q8L09_00230 [Candidatus Moranbacteria bacterium]|nr:hypothetical protein [Candidatus Moranbacteria bacterium]
MKMEKFIKQTVSEDYSGIKISDLSPFYYKNRVRPNHFILKDEEGREWFLKVGASDFGNMALLNDLYDLLLKKKFPALYPARNKRGGFVTHKNDSAVQLFPFVKSDLSKVKNKRGKEISLFSSFYNIVNSDKRLAKKLNAEKFKRHEVEFREVLGDNEHRKKLKIFFNDFDELEKKANEYFAVYKDLKVCHGDCTDKNLVYHKKKLLMIDFDSVGLDDLRFEIFRTAHDNTRDVANLIRYMNSINRKLLPSLRFSRKDMEQLDSFLFFYTALRLRYKPVKEVLPSPYRRFFGDIRKYLKKNHR